MTTGAYPAFLHREDVNPACRGADTELFFPPPGNPGTHAKTICRICPLINTCRQWALNQPDTELYGIWGGMSDVDRRKWRKTQDPNLLTANPTDGDRRKQRKTHTPKPADDECQHCGTYVGNFRRIHMARYHANQAVAAA